MARARVTGPIDTADSGDSLRETYHVSFYGTDLPAVDSDRFVLTIGPTDTIATAETNLVDAVMALAATRGYAMARTRVAFPKVARGS